MKHIKTIAGMTALIVMGALYLVGCSSTDIPVAPDNGASGSGEYTVTVRVEPPEFLRTQETWNRWREPVEVSYAVDSSGVLSKIQQRSGIPLGKITHEDSTDDQWNLGSRHAGGMDVMLGYMGGRDLYSIHSNGMMGMHDADSGAFHYMVRIFEDSTYSGGSFGMPIPLGDVTLLAISEADTFSYHLQPVMGGHGYRYEANTDVPYGTYTLRLSVNPPDVYRTDETQNFWTTPDDIEFQSVHFDSTSVPTAIGNQTVVNTSGDTIEVALSAEQPEAFGAMGMAWTPLSGEETLRFALDISVPSVEIDQMPIYNTQVRLTVRNHQTGDSETKTLKPIYGPHGFYYGENFMTGMMMGGGTLPGTGGGHGGGMGMGGM